MEVAMTAISAASSGGDVGTSRACAYVVSARNMMNATLASAIKNPESRKYVFFARSMKYSAEHEAVSARTSRTLIRILTSGYFILSFHRPFGFRLSSIRRLV